MYRRRITPYTTTYDRRGDYTESQDLMDISTFAPSLHTSASTLSTMTGTTPTSAPSNSPWLFNQINSIPNDNFIHGGGFTPPVISNFAKDNSVRSVNSRDGTSSGRASNNSSPAPSLSSVTSNDDYCGLGKVNMTLTGPLRRRIPDTELSRDERDKRRVRRERNKVAAAKCRQKRVDQTNLLVNETEDWEEKNATLQNEIAKLEKQKEQLEFLLQAHKPMCKMAHNNFNMYTMALSTPVFSTSTSLAKTSSLETPTTEVVTPTSSMFTFPMDTETLPSSTLISNTSCGNEVIKVEQSSSDLSSPDSVQNLIAL
ncbi:uncharacterized protein LOC144453499 isoform X2 [Glandiceps talaboti]